MPIENAMRSAHEASSARPGEWRAGWATLLASSLGVGTTWIFFQVTAGLFIVPMQQDLKWSRSELAIGPLTGLLVGVCLPFVGLLIDRFGARRLVTIGSVGLAVGFLLLSFSPPDRVVFFSLVGFIAITGSLCSSVVFSRGLATWFSVSFGTAVGIMMTGVSVASAIAMPVLASTIEEFGWRGGFRLLAAIVAFVALPAILIGFQEAKSVAAAANPVKRIPLATLLKDMDLWLLVGATFLAALPIGGFLAHLQPILREEGLTPGHAAWLGSLFVILIGAGRLTIGVLLDRLHAPTVSGATLVLSAVGALVFYLTTGAAVQVVLIPVAIGLIGLAQGAESDYLKFFSLRLFGFERFALVLSLLSTAASVGMALGGMAFAAVFDAHGSYDAAIGAGAGAYLASGVLFARIRMPTQGPRYR